MESLKEFRGDFRELLKLGKETIYSKINSFNYYKQNKGFDINNDGIITNAEAVQRVIDRRDAYYGYDD